MSPPSSNWYFRLCLFWVKITSGNAFPEMRLFGWSRKFYFPEIEIRWPKKKAFDHGNAFTLLFFLQSISGKWERERERERARARKRRRSSPRSRAPAPVRDRELQLQSEIAIDGEIAPSIAISWRRRDRDRDPARSRSQVAIALSIAITARSSDWKHFWNWWFFFSGLWLVFSDLCFPSSFPNTRKFFPENFLKCNQTQRNIFLFRKLAFPENMYFPKNVLQQPNTA